jgi:hypothetical protein
MCKVYRMKLFAKNLVCARSRFWYFMGRLCRVKKANGQIISVNQVRVCAMIARCREQALELSFCTEGTPRRGTRLPACTGRIRRSRDVCIGGCRVLCDICQQRASAPPCDGFAHTHTRGMKARLEVAGNLLGANLSGPVACCRSSRRSRCG